MDGIAQEARDGDVHMSTDGRYSAKSQDGGAVISYLQSEQQG